MVTGADGMTREQRQPEASNDHHSYRSVPQTGDVLASKPTARADLYTVSIVPAASHATATRYFEALEMVRVLARALGVNGWFTCNHTHYARVASFRDQSARGNQRTR